MSNSTQSLLNLILSIPPAQAGSYMAILQMKLQVKIHRGFMVNIKKLNSQIDKYNKKYNENIQKISESNYQFSN